VRYSKLFHDNAGITAMKISPDRISTAFVLRQSQKRIFDQGSSIISLKDIAPSAGTEEAVVVLLSLV